MMKFTEINIKRPHIELGNIFNPQLENDIFLDLYDSFVDIQIHNDKILFDTFLEIHDKI